MFDWLTQLVSGSPVSYLVVMLSAGSDVLFPPIPSETIVITAGIVAARGALAIWLIVPGVALGAMIGDNVCFLLGAKIGDPVAERLLRGEKGRDALRWAEQAIARHGAMVVVAGRFIPGGRTASTLAAGTLGMPWRRFIVADLAAATLWALYTSLLGYVGGETFRHALWKPLAFSLGAAAAVALAVEGWRRLQRRRGRDILGDELEERERSPA